MLSDDNRIRINYDTATPKLKFEVDASTSKMADEVKQLESYRGIVDLIDKSQFLQQIVPPQKQMALWNAIINNSGAENREKLVVTDKEVEEMLQQQQANAGQAPREQIITNYKDAPEDIKRQIEMKDGFQPSQQVSPVQQAADAKNQGQPQAPEQDPNAITPDHILKADEQAHKQQMDKAKLTLDAVKLEEQARQADMQHTIAQKQANRPVGASSGK
jgi:hypothetical protein